MQSESESQSGTTNEVLQLLASASMRYKETQLSDDQIDEILRDTLSGSVFSEITMEDVTGTDCINAYEKIYVRVGNYHVWFATKDKKLIIKYAKVALV